MGKGRSGHDGALLDPRRRDAATTETFSGEVRLRVAVDGRVTGESADPFGFREAERIRIEIPGSPPNRGEGLVLGETWV